MRIFKAHEGKIGANALAYSPDGALLASGGDDGALRVWDLTSGKEKLAIKRHMDLVTGLGFLAGGKVLVSSSWDRTIRFWDLGTRKQLKRFQAQTSSNCLAVSHEGTQVVAAGWFSSTWNPSVHRWQFEVGPPMRFKTLTSIVNHEDQIGAVTFSPDGRWLATGSADRTTRLWDLKECRIGQTWKSRAWIQGLAFSPDSRTIAIAAGKFVAVRDLESGEEVARLANHRLQAISVCYSPDGRLLVSGSKDGSVCCWDVIAGRSAAIYRWKIGPVEAIAFSPDGMTASAGGEGEIAIWDIDS